MSTVSDTSLQKPKEPAPGNPPRHTIAEQLRFLKSYWVSDQKWKARLLLGGVLALTIAEIALTAGIGLGFQAALNALVAKQALGFAVFGGATLAGLGASAVASSGRAYMSYHLGQNWRGWMTHQFNDAWLKGKSYLRLQHKKRNVQEPDQRIAETIPNVTTMTVQLGLALFRSCIALVTFSVMLWHISPLMVGAAIVCAAGAHAATHWTGSSLEKLWKGLMNTEAKFRHALVRVRDNAKAIALAGFEPVEKETLKNKFNAIDAKKREFYKVNFRTSLVSSLNMNLASVVPIALSAPKFFAGTATLGGLELTRQVYGQFYNALSWFPQGYAEITGWSNHVSQLMDFQKDLEENKADITEKIPESEQEPVPTVTQQKPPPAIKP